ncbi:glycosyltransferase [Candidatus Merdisoma sp. JLR.KK011]|uniref:glycosyltransferase n=1 Tax=Candidatus Merdisoma sp. JLR.KK011 TaxID=3114299 RepID=UPI002FF18FD2
MERIGIIGCVAEGKNLYDGQTVSTRLWKDELGKKTGRKVYVVDTYQYRRRPFSVMIHWLVCMLFCSHIVIMLSVNGLRFFLPLLYYSNKLFKRSIYHRVIGGNLPETVERYPDFIKYMNSFEVNWVQSSVMVKKLTDKGLKNAEYLENFRRIRPAAVSEIQKPHCKPFRFCTFCRVSEAKGITIAVKAIEQVNKIRGEHIAVLHVYGPVEKEYQTEFEMLQKRYSDCMEYKGCVPSNEAVGVLKNYFMHLFPTTWEGEGFPGTLIDCYNAGLPTIASSWAFNSEYVHNGKTGYVYDWKRPEGLTENILKAIENSKDIDSMRAECLEEARKYHPDVIMGKIIRKMGL